MEPITVTSDLRKLSDFKYPSDLKNLANADDLAYFISLQESKPLDTPEHAAQKWNRRAESWKKERANHRKNDARVVSAVAYLEQRGLLQNNYDIVDIGCGPGRFAAAFAKRVHRVVGLDISEKMVAHGMEHIRSEGLTNATLHACDFQILDIAREGYKGSFDLVFSSMTPAIRSINSLIKSMEMSRGWCCHITCLDERNLLTEQLAREVFGKKMLSRRTGSWFYSLFNILFLLGYEPETSYEPRHQEILTSPDEEYVDFLMEQLLPPEEVTKENAEKIQNWLFARRNEEGLIREVIDSSYVRILWDVRNRTERPDYHHAKPGR